MSVHLECDRCGFQEQTSGVMLFAGLTGPGIPTARPELPAGWTRSRLPAEDGSAWDRELCPGCKAELLRFMAGAPVADIRSVSGQSAVCRGCGHHEDEGCGCPQRVLCPGCGHLRHGAPCPDHVSEAGPCGCKELTPPGRMKELGIYD